MISKYLWRKVQKTASITFPRIIVFYVQKIGVLLLIQKIFKQFVISIEFKNSDLGEQLSKKVKLFQKTLQNRNF